MYKILAAPGGYKFDQLVLTIDFAPACREDGFDMRCCAHDLPQERQAHEVRLRPLQWMQNTVYIYEN
jgi:hypothetical protein